MKLDKKGDLRRVLMILLVVMLLFFVANGLLGLALTSEEEKAQLEVELAQIESQMNVISAGLGQDFGGLLCGVDKIKYNDYKCEHIGFHVVKVLTVGVHNQRFNFSDFIADAHNCLMVVKSDCGLMAEEVIKIKTRIEEIKNRLEELP